MSIKIRAKIRFNGQDYSDPSQLPPEVRAAYEQAMQGKVVSGSVRTTRKFVINGQEFSDASGMPPDVRKLCEDVMTVMENNGHVTLPGTRTSEPLITKRQVQSVLFVVGVLLALALLFLATR